MSLITALRLEALHKDNFIDPLARQLKTFYDQSFKVFKGMRDDFSYSRQNLPCKSHTASKSHSIQVKPCPFQHTCWRSSAILNLKMGAPANLLQHKPNIPPFSRRTYTNGQTNKNKVTETAPSTARCITRHYKKFCCNRGPLLTARSLRRTNVKFALTLVTKALRGSR